MSHRRKAVEPGGGSGLKRQRAEQHGYGGSSRGGGEAPQRPEGDEWWTKELPGTRDIHSRLKEVLSEQVRHVNVMEWNGESGSPRSCTVYAIVSLT